MAGDISPTAHEGVLNDAWIGASLAEVGLSDAMEVGRGGFGVVFRCRQVGLHRVVAVKVLTAALPEDRARFVREQQAMGRLTGHPHIVAVLEVGETEQGLPYLVMPFYARGSVLERIRHTVWSGDEVVRLGIKMAGALESVHRVGVVHRDVKPANILLTDYGEPALTDFGIAHVSGGFRTCAEVFTGSPAFTAPEVLAGGAPSAAADVYGLGSTMFCALTGHAAFERRRGEQVVAQFLRITSEPVPDLRERGIDDDLAVVIEQAMARAPEDRPTAEQLGRHLQQLQAERGLPIDDMAIPGATRAAPVDRSEVLSSPPFATPVPVPAPVAAMIGRQIELSSVRSLLVTSRLVTVAGVGGVGKTTLAAAAARELSRCHPDGTWFIELADLGQEALLIEVIAHALGMRDQPGRRLIDIVTHHLAGREALMVLDNCEHLIGAVADIVQSLLSACPRLRILTTSREVLNVGGEAVLQLDPLPFCDPDTNPTLSTLASYDAVSLFVQRARAAVPGFALTAANSRAIAGICAHLDGLPLAIELAAARLRAMTPQRIAEALSDRYGLLTKGHRGAPARQRTLALCIDWSYELCTTAERNLWQQLTVFAGSFEFDTAQDVCGVELPSDRFLELLHALVEKSIVIRAEQDGTMRFRMLETLREYGRAHVADDELYHRLCRRHADRYGHLLAEAGSEWFTDRQVHWIRRLTHELPNIRAALQFNLAHSPMSALQMAADMRRTWVFQGMLSEGRRWIDRALAAGSPEPTPQRVYALVAMALIAAADSDLAAVSARTAEVRQLLDVVADPVAAGLVDFIDGFGCTLSGEVQRGQQCCRRALAATDDFEVQGHAMMTLGWLAEVSGDIGDALHWFENARALAEPHRDAIMMSQTVCTVGVGRWMLGEPDQAEQLLRRGLLLMQSVGDTWSGAQALEMLAWVAASRHDARRATVLMAAAAAASRSLGSSGPTFAAVGVFHDECERRAHSDLDTAEFDAAWSEGNSLSFDDAVAFVITE